LVFRDILGHTKEIEALKKAIAGERVAHAYLFAGPSGIGKGCVARAFASALNCTDGNGCGECVDCRQVEASTHPNLVEIHPTDKDDERAENGLIRIAKIRELQNAIKYKVDRGKKVVIIEDADRLVPAAANAFLKTLEEPPPDSVIILISSRAASLLPTVLSRCQRINFGPLAEETINGHLTGAMGLSPALAAEAARASSGALGPAIEYAESGIYEKRREIAGYLKTLKSNDTARLLKLAEEFAKRDDLTDVLELMKLWCRDRLVSGEGAPEFVIDNDNTAALRMEAGADGLLKSFSIIEQARNDITPPRYGNKQLTMEVLLIQMAENGVIPY
jgi:DNA polymerase-3 subunit delta'